MGPHRAGVAVWYSPMKRPKKHIYLMCDYTGKKWECLTSTSRIFKGRYYCPHCTKTFSDVTRHRLIK